MKPRASKLIVYGNVVGLLLLLANLAGGTSWLTTERSVTKIADGVYVIIHKDAVLEDWPEGNTIVIIGDRGVFVVDACFLTASAKEDIAEIRRLIPKPVRYLLNTHFHIDHNAGNGAYMEAFPDFEIVAHTETRRLMTASNPRVAAYFADSSGGLAKDIGDLKKSLASGKGEDGKPLSAEDKSKLPQQIAERERQMDDYKKFKYQAPTLLFDHDLVLDLGNREGRSSI